MEGICLLFPIVSFFTTLLLTPKWIKIVKKRFYGYDVNKFNKPKVAELGGIPVIAGFLSSCFLFIAYSTFVLKITNYLIYFFAGLSSILIISLIGLIDDLIGWKKGLKKWQRPLLTLFASVPISAVNAGKSVMNVPFIGDVDFGILYPLLIAPIGIMGASNAFNMLAGMNGLEASMGILVLLPLSFYSLISNQIPVFMLSASMIFSLLAFLIYNWYPAKIFPGNVLTYTVGSLIAIISILGNMERLALFVFSLYFLEFFLKARSKFKAESFGKPKKNGELELRYKKIYSLTHFGIWFLKRLKIKTSEKNVVCFILFLQALISMFSIIYVLQIK